MEVENAGEGQLFRTAAKLDPVWIFRQGGTPGAFRNLEHAAQALDRPDPSTVVWITAESASVEMLRKHAISCWGVDRTHLHTAGYWKRGESNPKDNEAMGY